MVIECEGNAYARDCGQLEEYGRNLKLEKPRLMLVAFRIDDECIRIAEKNPMIELYECDLKFTNRTPIR